MDHSHRLSQYGYMGEAPKNRIAEERKAKGMTQQQLADAVGAHWITISKLERGRIKLTTDWLEKLAEPLGVRGIDLLSGPSNPSSDTRSSFIGLADLEGPFSRLSGLKLTRKQRARQLKIEGSSYEPFLHAGDTVSLAPLRTIAQNKRRLLDGRLCFSDVGTKTMQAGFLYSAKKSNSYDLFWLDRRVLAGISAARIYLVTGIAFRVSVSR
jgi:transcriptional regulator with XRE-family HTH domain